MLKINILESYMDIKLFGLIDFIFDCFETISIYFCHNNILLKILIKQQM